MWILFTFLMQTFPFNVVLHFHLMFCVEKENGCRKRWQQGIEIDMFSFEVDILYTGIFFQDMNGGKEEK